MFLDIILLERGLIGSADLASRIFLSYRRSDASAEARSIFQWLERRYGGKRVFIDVDRIGKGLNFEATLMEVLSDCAALLVIIGPNWLKVDGDGRRRIDDPDDYVRKEIEFALRHEIPVLPVLVGSAKMPSPADLPADVRALSLRMAAIVSHDNFPSDMLSIGQNLDQTLGRAIAFSRIVRFAKLQSVVVLLLLTMTIALGVLSHSAVVDAALNAQTVFTAWRSPEKVRVHIADLAHAKQEIALSRHRLIESAEGLLVQKPLHDSTWIWALGQAISAIPDPPVTLQQRYLEYARDSLVAACGCFIADNQKHAVAAAWALLAYMRAGKAPPIVVIHSLLAAQTPLGWWSVTLDATIEEHNASVYATSFISYVLRRLAKDADIDSATRSRMRDSYKRAIAWLANQVPSEKGAWVDYPRSNRATPNLMFGAMILVAMQGEVDPYVMRAASRRLLRDFVALPGEATYFQSDNWNTLEGQRLLIDKYRHIPRTWLGLGLTVAYPHVDLERRAKILRALSDLLLTDFDSEAFRRQEWVLAEQVFLLEALVAMLEQPS